MTNQVTISKFKAHCLEIIDNLQRNNQSITITKRNKPVAKVEPLGGQMITPFNFLRHKAQINGDIIEPIDDKWSAESE